MLQFFNEESDFKCACGCGFDISDELKKLCDRVRNLAGIPLIVNSGARCKAHNKAIGASETSSHILGLAVDFKCIDSHSRLKIMTALLSLGINRIGLHKNFLHFDTDISKPGAMWFY